MKIGYKRFSLGPFFFVDMGHDRNPFLRYSFLSSCLLDLRSFMRTTAEVTKGTEAITGVNQPVSHYLRKPKTHLFTASNRSTRPATHQDSTSHILRQFHSLLNGVTPSTHVPSLFSRRFSFGEVRVLPEVVNLMELTHLGEPGTRGLLCKAEGRTGTEGNCGVECVIMEERKGSK